MMEDYKSKLQLNKNNFTLIVFILLALVATLFPPYNWGSERLRTIEERNKVIIYIGYLDDILPIKEYDFLFSSSKKEIFIGWGFDKNESTRMYLSLERHLIVGELILNYILCVLFASLFLLFGKKLEPVYKNKKVRIIIIIAVVGIIGSLILMNPLKNIFYKKEIITISKKNSSYDTDYTRHRDRNIDRSRNRDR